MINEGFCYKSSTICNTGKFMIIHVLLSELWQIDFLEKTRVINGICTCTTLTIEGIIAHLYLDSSSNWQLHNVFIKI